MSSKNYKSASFHESLSNAILEALSLGKPLAASAVFAVVAHQVDPDADTSLAAGYSELFREKEFGSYIEEQGMFEYRLECRSISNEKGLTPEERGKMRRESVERICAAMLKVANSAGVDGSAIIDSIRVRSGIFEDSGKNRKRTETDSEKILKRTETDSDFVPTVTVSDTVSGTVPQSTNTTARRCESRTPAHAPAHAPAHTREAGDADANADATQTPKKGFSAFTQKSPQSAPHSHSPGNFSQEEPFPDELPPGVTQEEVDEVQRRIDASMASVRPKTTQDASDCVSRTPMPKNRSDAPQGPSVPDFGPFPDGQPDGSRIADAIREVVGASKPGRPAQSEVDWHSGRDPIEIITATYGSGPWAAYAAQLGRGDDGKRRLLDIVETYWREVRAGEHRTVLNHAAVVTKVIKEAIEARKGA